MQTHVSHNDELRAEIAANALKRFQDEVKESGGSADELEPPEQRTAEDTNAEAKDIIEHEAKPAADDVETDTKVDPPADDVVSDKPAVVDAPKLIKIKVDGKEIEVDEAKVREAGIRAMQKESAADERLTEATRLLKEAKQTTERLPKGDAPKEPATESTELDVKALAHAIQDGSEDEAAEALKKLQTKPSGGLTADQAAVMIDERAEFRTAVNWYQSECKDIAEDPNLHRLFLSKEREKRAAGDNRPYRDLYGEIATEMRDWLGAKVPKVDADPLKDKRERKSVAGSQPAAASARKAAPEEQKAPTPSETIAQMAKARGQT